VSDVTTTPKSGLAHIDALLDDGPGWNWLNPARSQVFYSFSVATGTEVGVAEIGGLTAFNAAQQSACLSLLTYISQLTGITFTLAASGDTADIQFASTDIVGAGTAGLCRWDQSWSFDGDNTVTRFAAKAYIYLDNAEWNTQNNTPSPGSEGYETLLHELGHMLGLKHPFQGGTVLSSAEDNTANTVMSYTTSGGPYAVFSPYDIAALQWIYGGDGIGGTLGVATTGLYLVGTSNQNTLNGGSGNDTLESLANSDTLNGGAGDDTAVYTGRLVDYTIATTAGGYTIASAAEGVDTLTSVEFARFADQTITLVQTISGTAVSETLTGTAGNDAIDGKAGNDTAVYTARMAAYTVSPTAISGPDGSDTLTSVERLQFTDAFLAFDLDGNAGQTYRLYQAAFNRTPDLGGLGGWIAAMDSGTTLAQVATSFMGSAEFQALYGANPSNEQFVSLLYTNALHRTADAGGLAYWVNQLTSNLQTRAQALVNFSESTENKASVLPAITKGIVYANAAQAAGPAKGQSFTGTSSADSLIGTVGNDTLTGGAGNDSLNGGGGLDTAIYSGTRASHTTTNASGALTVSGSTNGVDTLSHVERLKFDDAILAFDTSGNAGQTYRLYQAAFNRTPDKAGLSGWIKGVDQGLSMLKVAAAFIESGEFKTLYGNSPTDSAFVNLLYTNALHRTADAGGLEYWVNQLSSHAQSREQALLGFSESAENQASLIGVIQNGIELTAG
jgi:serralysin